MDKKKALEASLAGIEKAYGKGAVMRLGQNIGMTVESIPTGAISLISHWVSVCSKRWIIEIYD
jgi:recombination protein RecA